MTPNRSCHILLCPHELYPYLLSFGMEKLRVPCHAAMPPYCHAIFRYLPTYSHIPTSSHQGPRASRAPRAPRAPIQAIPPLHLAGVLRSSPPAAPPGRCWPAATGRSRSPRPRGGATLSPPPKKCHAPPGDQTGWGKLGEENGLWMVTWENTATGCYWPTENVVS